MPELRSRTSTHGRQMAGARALWRATGMEEGDFGKPIIAIANSYTQFVPGHVHLKDMGDLVAGAIREAGGVSKEFNTIAVDDGIAMGHAGMLYSLPSRELIADSVEYMVNAHTADALVCISNCDKITPGMLMAALRLNIPAIFVSGGPMEAGKAVVVNGVAIDEPYLKPGSVASTTQFDITVPAGRIWVMGDNRGNSQDSRFHDPKGDGSEGSVPMSKVTGRAFALVWPLNHMSWLSNYPDTFARVPATPPSGGPTTPSTTTTTTATTSTSASPSS